MKSNARRGAPVRCSRYVSRKILALREEKVDQVRGWREAQVFVNPGFEGLKIVSAPKDRGKEGVPVP